MSLSEALVVSSVTLDKGSEGFSGKVPLQWGRKVLYKVRPRISALLLWKWDLHPNLPQYVVDGIWQHNPHEDDEKDGIGNTNNVFHGMFSSLFGPLSIICHLMTLSWCQIVPERPSSESAAAADASAPATAGAVPASAIVATPSTPTKPNLDRPPSRTSTPKSSDPPRGALCSFY